MKLVNNVLGYGPSITTPIPVKQPHLSKYTINRSSGTIQAYW